MMQITHFLKKFNENLDKHAPLKYMSRKQQQNISKQNKKYGLKIWQGISKLVKTKPTKRQKPKSLHISKRIKTNSLKIAS